MAQATLTITKAWADGTSLTESQLDNIKTDTESWGSDVKDNMDQLRLDVFGSGYSYDNDGTANNTNPMNIQQTITPTATITGLDIVAAATTTGTALDIGDLDAMTTGFGINVVSNSTDTSTRSLCQLTNDNTAATGCTPLQIQQDAAQRAAYINQTANGSALVIDTSSTTANVISIPNADSLTTGGAFSITSNSSSSGSRSLFTVINDNTAATGTDCVTIRQDSANRGLLINMDGSGTSCFIDTDSNSGSEIYGLQIDSDNAGGWKCRWN